MAHVFVIAGVQDPALHELRLWLDYLTEWVGNDPNFTPDQVNRRAF